jgi:myo-inositol catabolism protein IolC
MPPEYSLPLFFLAFDHRSSFEKGLFNASPPVSPEVRDGIVKEKEIIYEANRLAVAAGAPQHQSGILVDEQFGAAVARRAAAQDVPLAMPAEVSGQDEFEFQYGDDFGKHIEEFDPTFCKVLVRYNPEGDPDLNRRQAERLARLTEWLRTRKQKFLFELIVPATTQQLDMFEGHQDDYDTHLRPKLAVESIAALQKGGVGPDIWKVEGLDKADDAVAIVNQARSGGRDDVICIVLGRGADWDKVVHWIEVGAGVEGFEGFAVGRTLWHDALVDQLAGRSTPAQASQTIADRYRKLMQHYDESAVRAGKRP